MNSLGSLKDFLPEIPVQEDKACNSFPISANQSFRSVSVKKSAKSLNLSSHLSISKIYLVTSNGGYNFSNPIIQTQRKFLSQTSRSVRPAQVSRKKSRSILNETCERSEKVASKANLNLENSRINIFEENIRHELQMKNSHYLVRTMKKLKVEEEIGTGTYRAHGNSNKLSDLALSLMNTGHKSKIESKQERTSSYRPINLTTAKEKLHQFRVNSWACKSIQGRRKSIEFNKFILNFFNEIDSEKTGILAGEKLVESLVYLGLATDPSVIRKTLCLIYKCQNLNSLKIRVKDFTELFKNDNKTDKILEKLDEFCRNLKKSSQDQEKKENSKQFNHSQTSFLASNGFSHKTKKVEVVTINEHLETIDKWWKKLDAKSSGSISIEDMIDFFCSIKIASDKNEAKSLITSQIGVKRFLDFNEFQQTFAKSMLKAALLNLSNRLSNDQFVGQDLSQGFKLQSYQKSLLMSGVKCRNSGISEEEGEKALKAIEKYNLQAGKEEKKSFEEIKEGMLKILGLTEFEYIRKRKLIDDKGLNDKSNELKSERESKSFDFRNGVCRPVECYEGKQELAEFFFEPSDKAVENLEKMMSCSDLQEDYDENLDLVELDSPTLDKGLYRRETFITYKADEKFLKRVKLMLQSKKKSANDSQFLRKYQSLIRRTTEFK